MPIEKRNDLLAELESNPSVIRVKMSRWIEIFGAKKNDIARSRPKIRGKRAIKEHRYRARAHLVPYVLVAM